MLNGRWGVSIFSKKSRETRLKLHSQESPLLGDSLMRVHGVLCQTGPAVCTAGISGAELWMLLPELLPLRSHTSATLHHSPQKEAHTWHFIAQCDSDSKPVSEASSLWCLSQEPKPHCTGGWSCQLLNGLWLPRWEIPQRKKRDSDIGWPNVMTNAQFNIISLAPTIC